MTITINIVRSEKNKPPDKLADAELQFTGGEARWAEAAWLRYLATTPRVGPQCHLPGAPVHGQRRTTQLRTDPGR